MIGKMLSCQEVADLLCDYIEGDVSEEDRVLIEKHLHMCKNCDRFIAQYRKTTSICRETLAREIPEELENRMLSALRERLDRAG